VSVEHEQLDEHEPLDEQLDDGSANGAASESILESLRARRDDFVGDRYVDLEVPGWAGCLALRCGSISSATMRRLRQRLEKSRSPDRDFNYACDVFVAACREVRGRANPQDRMTTLVLDGEPLRLDLHLASALGFQAAGARDVVRQLFERAPTPDVAVGATIQRYIEWAGALDEEIDDEYVGESSAAPS
jgi:hypothetical protein